MTTTPRWPLPPDEQRHPVGDDPRWAERWAFGFVSDDGAVGGWVALDLHPTGAAYRCVVARPGRPAVGVVDDDVPLPRAGLLVRGHGLWADHVCETPFEHWTVANEVHALAVDDPAELLGPALGVPTPLGLDLEWESDPVPAALLDRTGYVLWCDVNGEVLVGDERIDVTGRGWRDHRWGPE